MFYLAGLGPCPPVRHALFTDAAPVYTQVQIQWPTLLLYLFLVSSLLAAVTSLFGFSSRAWAMCL